MLQVKIGLLAPTIGSGHFEHILVIRYYARGLTYMCILNSSWTLSVQIRQTICDRVHNFHSYKHFFNQKQIKPRKLTFLIYLEKAGMLWSCHENRNIQFIA